MAVSSPALHEALADIAGREHVIADRPALSSAAVDGVVPRWLVRPGTDLEVSRLLALATAEALAVAPRGSGSNQSLGMAPDRVDMVVDLTRLSGVTEYVPEDMVASAGAGTTLGALAAHLAPHRQRLCLDPLRGGPRTIGGVLACNASGPLRCRYGTGRDMLLGVRFVQSDGTITWGGSKVVKSVTGYDVPKLLVGSLGTLGIIVGATLRLQPLPSAARSWLCAFETSAATGAFLGALLASSIEPERLCVASPGARAAAGAAGPGPAVLISIASDEEAVASQGAALADLARRSGGDVVGAGDATWAGLDAAVDAPVLLKVAGEPRRIATWYERAHALADRAASAVAIVGQAGDGVLHVALDGIASSAVLDGIVTPLRDELRDEGGSVVVERAPSAIKGGIDVWGPAGAEALAIMARLKRELDPAGVLNPGRFVGGL